MKRTVLIINAASGSAGAVGEADLVAGLTLAGFEPIKTFRLPGDELPNRTSVEALAADVVAVVSGDGTIASVCEAMAGWSGEILVFPGGTMNLLAKRLHGDGTIADLLERLAEGPVESSEISVIRTADKDVLTGLIAGPSTEWGRVRESIRNLDIAEIAAKLPEAWAATTSSESVRIEGYDGGYPAIFVEPLDNGNLAVRGIKADGVGDMLSHGIAWLRRDFRDGPHDDLGERPAVKIIDDVDKTLGLLIDGEQEEGQSPFTCTASKSSVRFIRTAS
jgi:hypothetical protein